MRDFLTPFLCGGDGGGCSCGAPIESKIVDPDCGDDCACHDETTDSGCDCDNGECC